MTFRVSGTLDLDAQGAVSEINRTRAAVRDLGSDAARAEDRAEQLSDDLGRAARSAGDLARRADGAEAGVKDLADAMVRATGASRGLGAASTSADDLAMSTNAASGAAANLSAQFIDIGTMLASGQNPFLLAIQQGGQIIQIFGQQGVSGIMGMVRAAFARLATPVGLATVGLIAGAGALVTWARNAMGAEEETMDLADAMEALNEAGSDVSSWADLAAASAEDLRERFGEAAPVIQALADAIADISFEQAVRAADDAVTQIVEKFGSLSSEETIVQPGGFLSTSLVTVEKRFLTEEKIAEEFGITETQVRQLTDALLDLSAAEGPAAVAREAKELNDTLIAVFGSVDRIPDEFLEVAQSAGDVARQLTEAEQKASGGAEAARDMAASFEDGTSRLVTFLEASVAVAEARAADRNTAIQLNDTLKAQQEILFTALQYGEDSAAVAGVRYAQERAVLEAQLDQLDITEETRDAILQNFDTVKALEAAAYAAADGFDATAEAVYGIAAALGIAIDEAAALLGLVGQAGAAAAPTGPDQARLNVLDGTQPGVNAPGQRIGEVYGILSRTSSGGRRPGRAGRGAGGGGGGAGAARQERDAVDDLIASLERELELLRETDPVRQEMLRHREALAGATEAERAQVEELIRTREQEEQQMEALQARQEAYRDLTWQALDELIFQAESWEEALGNALAALLRYLAQAAALGTGPFGDLFGGTDGPGGGGWIGQIIGAFVGQKADGGMIYGPGGPRDDRVPILASAGEFVVNAAATARHRTLLEEINAGGRVGRFADGGLIGRGTPAGSAASGGPVAITVDVRGARGNADIEESTRRGIRAALDEYDRAVLPRSVQRVLKDPEAIG